MSRLESFSGKIMDLVDQVGDNIRVVIPDGAGRWLQAGAVLGAAKTGARTVGTFTRRNPALVAAVAVGVGVACYAVWRYRKKKRLAQGETIEGEARRIEAKPTATRTRRAARATRHSRD